MVIITDLTAARQGPVPAKATAEALTPLPCKPPPVHDPGGSVCRFISPSGLGELSHLPFSTPMTA